ncbi:hypothetical protein C4B63_462g15 [Trypanosoma cruzi]|uniref:Uncharacterized protein n=1 Tax=Trypanosoma cruzi TaxID=5693 RepID=A0A2V2UFF8_TRYCR|nr:hypothetical protein C4B63_462g15 [Trypanosoma cruzi]
MWFNVYRRRWLFSRPSVVHIRVANQNIAQGNFLYPPHRTQPEEGPQQQQQQETLHGHALENRVRTRQHLFPRTYHLPDGHTVLHVDDFRRIPEAAPPPATEEGLRRQREEAERVPSPVFYGRSSYLLRSMSSILVAFAFRQLLRLLLPHQWAPSRFLRRIRRILKGPMMIIIAPASGGKQMSPLTHRLMVLTI